MKLRKWIALLLCLGLLSSICPTAAALGEGGGFWLTASTETRTILEPVEVRYTAGQTVAQALEASGYTFEGLENGYITAIEGVTGNFLRFYDGGGYQLERPASEITALVFAEKEIYSEALLQLVDCMGRYRLREDHVQNDPAAQTAYANALKGLRSADAATAQTLLDALQQAIADYEAMLQGPKYTLRFTVTQGTATLTAPELTLTDAYGNVTQATGTEAALIAGEYQYVVSDGGRCRAEGQVSVGGESTLAVELPSGEWFGQVCLRDGGSRDYPAEYTTGQGIYQVPDHAKQGDTFLYAGMGAVPDRERTRLRTIYTDTNGKDTAQIVRSWESSTTALANLLLPGMEGCSFQLEAQYDTEAGYTMIQTYEMTVRRVPTLRELTLTGDGSVLALDFDPDTTAYSVKTVSERLEVDAQAFGEEGYTVQVDGGDARWISTAQSGIHTVVVLWKDGASRAYTIEVMKADAVEVTLQETGDLTVQVINAAGSVIAPSTGQVYRLIPGESYICSTTRDTYYHAERSFVASAGLCVAAPAPERVDAMTGFALYDNGAAANRQVYPSDQTFRPDCHSYTYTVPDANITAYLQLDAAGYTASASYAAQSTATAIDGQSRTVTLSKPVSATGGCDYLGSCLARSGQTQTVVILLSRQEGQITYTQEYRLRLVRSLHLSALSLLMEEEPLTLTDEAGNSVSFSRNVTEYWLTVQDSAELITLRASFTNELDTTACCGGYSALVNGALCESLQDVALTLDPAQKEQTVEIELHHRDENSIVTVYALHITKRAPVQVTFQTDPAEAIVFIVNPRTGRQVAVRNGVAELTPGMTYRYTVTCTGYVAVQEEAYVAPEAAATLRLKLAKAADNPALQDLSAQWPSFRADKENNGVVQAKTPIRAEEAMLSWATKLGEGYSADACGCPILVDGCVYTYAGTTLYKVDAVSGEVLATGTMDHSSSFAINPPTYAEGMLFVGLSDGCVQAFNAATLESLWIYRDAIGGQPNCPLTYDQGYLYTGFWLGETQEANFVCLSVTDEDPAQPLEEKTASWTHTELGGFYWAGAYVSDGLLLVGTDDGAPGYTTGYGSVLSLDPASGQVRDRLLLPEPGDVRSTIMYDSETDRYYFTTKGGQFYGVQVEDGLFRENSLRVLELYNYASDGSNPAMSTCTPTVYNGRAYVGVSGVSQFGAYSGHNITVVDLEHWEIAYTVRTQGYPQTSGILTTAYDGGDGTVYVYFFDNYTPGKLRMLQDRPGQTEPVDTVVETFQDSGKTYRYDTAYVLFTPDGAQAQYAICSPIVDEYGTIYFKNDSAYLMALSSTIQRIEITKQPDCTSYAVGEAFDPAGMVVTATYANGMTRDVTAYVTWSTAPLTAEDTELEIRFPYACYQDKEGTAGVRYDAPVALLTLEVGNRQPLALGDINEDGVVDLQDADALYAAIRDDTVLTARQRKAADMNGDGSVDLLDAAMLYAKVNRKDGG